MKKSILIIALSTGIGALTFNSCNSATERVENAQEDVVKAALELDKVTQEYLADVERYKQQTADKIAANQKSIDEFNQRIEKEKKEVQADYRKKMAALEEKNSDLKKKMDDYKADSKDNWEDFKREFNHDMEELSKAISDFFKTDKK